MNIQKTRDFYAQKKGAKILQQEFGYFVLDRWISEGHIKDKNELAKLVGLEDEGMVRYGNLGWCEAAFYPVFEEKVLEDRGEYELVQDFAGRHVLYFKDRRHGFMPEYLDHPVKDKTTWERDVKWRMAPDAAGRFGEGFKKGLASLEDKIKQGAMVGQNIIGGYMYLRSLAGPEDICM